MYLDQQTVVPRPDRLRDDLAPGASFAREILVANSSGEAARIDIPLDGTHLLVMARRGVRRLEIGTGETSAGHTVTARSFTAIPAGTATRVVATGQGAHELHLFRFGAELVGRAGRAETFPSFVGLSDPRLAQLADLAVAMADAPEPTPELVWEAFGTLLLNRLPSAPLAPAFQRGGLAPWQVRRTTDFMHSNLGRNIALKELAELVGLSPFHFARAFKQSVGDPPHRYLARRRIERACELLATSEMSVIEIAAQLGYEAPGALSRMFRREVGLSPSDYRRRAQSTR
jgi:AraC-like DNA-binding protein